MAGLTRQDIAAIKGRPPNHYHVPVAPADDGCPAGDVVFMAPAQLHALCDLAAVAAALTPPPQGQVDLLPRAQRRAIALLMAAVPLPAPMEPMAALLLAAAHVAGGTPTTEDMHFGRRDAGLKEAFMCLNALSLEAKAQAAFNG